jgi:hypothetical protein
MNQTARAVVFLFVVCGLVVSVAPRNSPSHNSLAALLDGLPPPVPPKAVSLDGSQPPVPPKMTGASARFLDGSQPPVPPKMMAAVAAMFDGSQPPVPPKALEAAV